jgi:predicted MFS family arabinose efflux permease
MPARLPIGALLALAAVATWIVVTELLPAAVLPQLSAALRVTPGQAGYLASAFAAAATVAAIPFAALTRGLPRRPTLIVLIAGLAVASAATAASSSYALTFALRIAAGLLNGAVWSMLASYAARIAPPAQRGRAVALTLAGITVALTAGLPASAAVASQIGWRATFALLAVTGAALVVWVRAAIPPLAGEPPGDRPSLLTVARRPGIRPVLATTALLLSGHQAMYTYIAPVAARAGLRQPGLPLLVFGAATVAGIALAGALADRWPRPALGGSVGLVAAALALLAADGRSLAGLLVASALWGTGFGAAPALLQAALTTASGPRYAAVASSFQTTVYNTGIAAGAFAGGAVLDARGAAGLPPAALVLVLAALAAAALTAQKGLRMATREPASPGASHRAAEKAAATATRTSPAGPTSAGNRTSPSCPCPAAPGP